MSIDVKSIAQDFVNRLKEMDRGELAALKRNAGNGIEQSRGVMGVFYSIIPRERFGKEKEEVFFLLSTLFAINPVNSDDRNLGSTIKKLQRDFSENTLDARLTALLDESINRDFEAVSHRLRQFVLMAKGKNYGINWCQLLQDLYWWDASGRYVQKSWARAYFGKGEVEQIN